MIIEIKDPKNYLDGFKIVIEVSETAREIWHNDLVVTVYDKDEMCTFSEPVAMIDKVVKDTNQPEIN